MIIKNLLELKKRFYISQLSKEMHLILVNKGTHRITEMLALRQQFISKTQQIIPLLHQQFLTRWEKLLLQKMANLLFSAHKRQGNLDFDGTGSK